MNKIRLLTIFALLFVLLELAKAVMTVMTDNYSVAVNAGNPPALSYACNSNLSGAACTSTVSLGTVLDVVDSDLLTSFDVNSSDFTEYIVYTQTYSSAVTV